MINKLEKEEAGYFLKAVNMNFVVKQAARVTNSNVSRRNQLHWTQTGGKDSKFFLPRGANFLHEYAKRCPKNSNFLRRNFIIYINAILRAITSDNWA